MRSALINRFGCQEAAAMKGDAHLSASSYPDRSACHFLHGEVIGAANAAQSRIPAPVQPAPR